MALLFSHHSGYVGAPEHRNSNHFIVPDPVYKPFLCLRLC